MEEVYRSPWFNLEGYLACTVKYSDGTKKTVLQHREVMEKTLGRALQSTELVHHDDENKRNNAPSNLVLTTKSEHARHHNPEKLISLICRECNKRFERNANIERHNRKQGKKGPFCGKPCAVRWSHRNYKWGKRGPVRK